MSQENKIILLSAKIFPSEKDLESLNSLIAEIEDWESMVKRLLECSVSPLFYLKVPNLSNTCLIPATAYDKLKKSYYYTLTRGMLMYQVLQETLNILHENRIDVIVLKGAYLAEKLYEDVALRLFSDIDVLVKQEEASKAFEALSKAGFTYTENDEMLNFLHENVGFEHLPQLIYKGIAVELHVRLHKQEEAFEFHSDKMWKHAEVNSLAGVSVLTPDLPDLLIHTVLHLSKHFRDGEIQFTGFNDIVNILEVYRNKLDWIEIIRRSIQYQCEEVVFKFIVLAHRNYKAYVPNFIISEYIEYATEEDQELFEKYLLGYQGEHFSVSSGIKRIKNITEPAKRLKYILWMMFPSKTYMIRSYQIKNPKLYIFYYPYRYWLGVKGLIRTLRQSKKKKD